MPNPKNILIVEDDPDWQRQIKAILEREHYKTDTAASYGEALGELRRKHFHLAIVDLRLSPADKKNRDGIALLDHIFERRIPTIIITGYGTPTLADSAYKEYNVFSFLDKASFDATRFREVVRQAIASEAKIQGGEKWALEKKRKFHESTKDLFSRRQVSSLWLWSTILSCILILGGLILTKIGSPALTEVKIGYWSMKTNNVGLVLAFLGVVLFAISVRPLIIFLKSHR